MPDGWTALKCEGCGNPPEPLSDMRGIIHLSSRDAVEALTEAVQRARMDEGKYNRMPVIGGDFHVEMVDNPLAGMLRCTSCGLLYEKGSDNGG